MSATGPTAPKEPAPCEVSAHGNIPTAAGIGKTSACFLGLAFAEGEETVSKFDTPILSPTNKNNEDAR